MVSVRWTGAAGLEVTHDGRTYLIDPYFTRASKGAVLFGRMRSNEAAVNRKLDDLPGELTAVIANHTHFDHVVDFPTIARRFNGPIVGSSSLETVLDIHGFRNRVTVCRGGERVELPGGASVTMIESRHGKVLLGRVPFPGEVDPMLRPPLRARDYRHGTVFVVKLEIGGVTIMQIGSADLLDDRLAGHACDVLYLCVPGWEHAPGYIRRAVTITGAKVLVPFHYDDFTRPLRPDGSAPTAAFMGLSGFMAQLPTEAAGVRVSTPNVNEVLEF